MTAGATTVPSRGPLGPLLDRFEIDLAGTSVQVPQTARAYALAQMAARAEPLLVVTPRTSDAEALTDGLGAFLGPDRVAYFPPWETLPHERLSPTPATVGRRLAVIDRLVRPADSPLAAVVAPVRAVLQPMDPQLGDRPPLRIDRHLKDGLDGLIERLVELGYERVNLVDARGEFAVRGGLVDVFPTGGEHAVRVEFWGDDVDSIREFAVIDQRSTGPVDIVRVDAARELVINDLMRELASKGAKRHPRIADQILSLAEGILFEGVESLVTLLHPRPALLPDFVPLGGGLAIVDPLLVQQRADKLLEEASVLLDVAWESASGDRPDDAGFADPEEVRRRANGPVWDLSSLGTSDLDVYPPPTFKGDISGMAKHLAALLVEGQDVVIATESSPARLVEVLNDEGLPSAVVDVVQHRQGRAQIVSAALRSGFVAPTLGLALLGDHDLYGPRRTGRAGRRLGTRQSAHDVVVALDPGDFVVHRFHGVGRYCGMTTRTVRHGAVEIQRDYVELEYAKGDRLFVPTDQVDAVARYQGADQPSLMRLGGAEWDRAKGRVRGAVRDVAAELIRLHAVRQNAPGTAASPDGEWQSQLESAFVHAETPDQLVVVDEIKRDLEAERPMDRVLAGDVGFGKTEVAVRAAAKAIFDGRQVAVLVPTTLLAQQHYETFRERFASFPVDIRMLSRFVSPAERRDTVEGLAAGTTDLVIGTHALLGRDIAFHDLGLVVIDEEQRFGVTHKERLKQLRTSVDVLSMTATPIPRTLEMAVSGIRDLSVIETPPEDRQPVVTVVGPYDQAQIALAIRRELLRDGQVFYVHNQVDTIDSAASYLRELVPDARVEVGHGQMDEALLESLMLRFWDREFDVLCCTTIIESGLDIPNANTLIVERADMLGLAQMHQLRGRVGRSTQRGYAYLFHPSQHSMTEAAYDRLQTVAEHSRLGSGLSIALRDLELRGAGNVVGAEQSGHVAAVGFDMYAQLLAEEVADLKGEVVDAPVEIKLDLPVDARLPDDYVSDPRQRLALYRRIAATRDAAGIRAVAAELKDRFGSLPAPAERLLGIAALRAALRAWGLADVALTSDGELRVRDVHLAESQHVRLTRTRPGATWSPQTGVLRVPLPRPGPDDVVAWVADTLKDVTTPVNRG